MKAMWPTDMQHKEGGQIHADLTFNSNQTEKNAVAHNCFTELLKGTSLLIFGGGKTISGMHFCYLKS